MSFKGRLYTLWIEAHISSTITFSIKKKKKPQPSVFLSTFFIDITQKTAKKKYVQPITRLLMQYFLALIQKNCSDADTYIYTGPNVVWKVNVRKWWCKGPRAEGRQRGGGGGEQKKWAEGERGIKCGGSIERKKEKTSYRVWYNVSIWKEQF